MEGVTNQRVEMMAQRKREKMSSRMRRRSISEDWILCARHSRCQKVVDVEGKAGRCCHRHCPDAASSVNRNYLLPDNTFKARAVFNAKEVNQELRYSLDVHTVVDVFHLPALHPRVPDLESSTRVDSHLGHEAWALCNVKCGVGGDVLLADSLRVISILLDEATISK